MKLAISFLLTILVVISPTADAAERGKAYIYPPESEGYATASGEVFRHADFTAGHAKLPFGTIVKVTNIWNGKSVNVRINDRRSHRTQLIRLSHAAAAQLDMLNHGVMDVDVETVGTIAPQMTSAPSQQGIFGLFGSKTPQSTQATSMPQETRVVPKGIGASGAAGNANSYTVPYSTAQSTNTGRIAPPPVPTVAATAPGAVAPAPVAAPAPAPVAAPAATQDPLSALKGSFSKGSPTAAPQGRYWLQFASFPDARSAKDFAKVIKGRGAPTRVVSDPNGMVHRVVSDHFFQSKNEATAAAKRTAAQVGYHSVVQGG